jgi:ribonuclease HIII
MSTPTLTRNGPASYYCAMPAAIGAWLVEQGYRSEDPRSQYEYLRFKRAKSLIIVYHNGTVLIQGADTPSAHQLLSTLVLQPVTTEQLPF